MKVVKGFFKFLLTVIVICLLAAIALVLSYTLSSPNTAVGHSSRDVVSGPWEQLKATEKDDELFTFTFSQSGEFTIQKGKDIIADGYFKINEKSSKIKLFMMPGHYTSDFEKYVKYKVFGEVSYSNLQLETTKEFNEKAQLVEDNLPTCSFLIRTQDGSENTDVFDCEMHEYTLDLYAADRSLAKDAG
ncbi:MAG: hypothetical protein IJ723_02610 [Ruminococcus sp.]|nr:hypothetical protein [Ruminococcus sp.]